MIVKNYLTSVKRFELVAALALSLIRPAFENVFGQENLNLKTIFIDYSPSVFLLAGTFAIYRKKEWGIVFLPIAWAWATGMMTEGLLAEIVGVVQNSNADRRHSLILCARVIMWGTAIVATVLSFRRTADMGVGERDYS